MTARSARSLATYRTSASNEGLRGTVDWYRNNADWWKAANYEKLTMAGELQQSQAAFPQSCFNLFHFSPEYPPRMFGGLGSHVEQLSRGPWQAH